MNTIMLDCSGYDSPKALHAALKAMLSLPDYYGGNADALYDCLSELKELPRLWIVSLGEGEVRRAAEKVRAVFEDLGAEVREI